jgi:putative membrane protein
VGEDGEVIVALLIRWAVFAAAFAVTAWLLDGMDVSGGFGTYLWLALLFGIINSIIGTILRLLTLPLMVVTLGLFSIVINAFLLKILDWISDHFTIDHFFWTAIWGAIILAIVSVVLDLLVGRSVAHRHAPAAA